MSRQSEIRAKWNRKWKLGKTGNDQRMVLDDRGNYMCSVQVYQSPRHMGEYDEDRRIANAALIVSAPSDLRYLLDRLEAAHTTLEQLLCLAAWDDFATDDGSEHPVVAKARQFLKESL